MIESISSAAAYLRGADDILILTHARPDGDTAGSAYALCLALRSLGKRAYIMENPDITPLFEKYHRALTPPPEFVPKSLVAVDIAARKLLFPEAKKLAERGIDLVVDHHISRDLVAEINVVDSLAAATGEIIWELLPRLGVSVTADMAEGAFVALITDTGCFRYSNTRPETHLYAAEMMRLGVDSATLCRLFFETKSRARFEIERRALDEMRFYADGQIAVIPISLQMIADCKAGDDDIDGISALSRLVEGVEVGVTVKEAKSGTACKISLRTNRYVNASEVCAEFGGGGHARAAGCFVEKPLEEALEAVVKAARRHLLPI